MLDTNILINYYFEEIAKIPHGSFHEEKLADYVQSVAELLDLKYVRDEMNNIVIYEDASIGYEEHAPLMLEAHMDMVNEKTRESQHDFDTDGLNLYIEDGYLHARGTTLGADDAYGVSYMLSILTDKTLKHPALECVFTVQEEVGLCGAMGLDASLLHAKRMIGLDSESEGETCTSSSGGNEVVITKPIHYEKNSANTYRLNIGGLLGGHSGSAIDKGRGNAIKLVGRILYSLTKEGYDLRLIEINGGLKNNAIPRDCEVVFASFESFNDLQEKINEYTKDIQQEYMYGDPHIQITFNQEEECNICMKSKESDALIQLIYLALNGCLEKSQMIEGLTVLSLNIGVIKSTDNAVRIEYCLRSPLKSARMEMVKQLELLGYIFNASVEMFNDFPGWDYDDASLLRKQFKDFYLKYTNHELREVATHGGLETGVFKGKIPELDIITMGPDVSNIHTPQERMNIESFVKNYELLVDFIATL